MALQVYSVFDNKVGSFANPFFVRTRGEAVRSFTDAAADDNLPFKKHPGDYVLFFLGQFYDDQGVLEGGKPERVMGADEV